MSMYLNASETGISTTAQEVVARYHADVRQMAAMLGTSSNYTVQHLTSDLNWYREQAEEALGRIALRDRLVDGKFERDVKHARSVGRRILAALEMLP